MPYRIVYAGLGLLVLAVITLGVVFAREGESVDLPPPLESVSPEPGMTVIRQATVEIRLEFGYEADIFVDGFLVPDADFTSAIGVYRWAPSPTSVIMDSWTPGEHTVRVEWRRIAGAPDFGSFEWSFRVQ
ncbi:hypothetical protein BH23ACT5_BH23ACT5_03770 [soil metagenome]